MSASRSMNARISSVTSSIIYNRTTMYFYCSFSICYLSVFKIKNGKRGQSPFPKIERAGTLAVSNTTINYTQKLPAANKDVCTDIGKDLKPNGGALFVKLLATPTGYIGANDKVKVTLTDVTTAFTGKADADENKEGQNAPYGIFTNGTMSTEKNLVVEGQTPVTDPLFVSYKAQ